MQFFEVDLPPVSEAKVELVDAVIPDKVKVRTEYENTSTMHSCSLCGAASPLSPSEANGTLKPQKSAAGKGLCQHAKVA